MSSNLKPVSPVQDLLDGIIELKCRLEDLESTLTITGQSRYENVRTSLRMQNQPYGRLELFGKRSDYCRIQIS